MLCNWPRLTQELDSMASGLDPEATPPASSPDVVMAMEESLGCPHSVQAEGVQGVHSRGMARGSSPGLPPLRTSLPTSLRPARQPQAPGAAGLRPTGRPQDGRKGEGRLGRLHQTKTKVFKNTVLDCWAKQHHRVT